MSPFVILLVIAMILFIMAAIPIPSNPVSLGWLGCFMVCVAFLVGR